MTPSQAAAADLRIARQTRTVLKVAARSAAAKGIELMRERTRSVIHPWWGTAGVIDTQRYLNGWKVQAHGGGFALFNDTPYSEVIEFGRRPGARPPPVSALIPWVQRKLMSAGPSRNSKGRFINKMAQARSIAFLVARAIGKRGTPGRKVMTGAYAIMANKLDMEVRVATLRLINGNLR